MGHFLAATAFKTSDMEEVIDSISDYAKKHGVSADMAPNPVAEDWRRDAQLYAPDNGWTVVIWPDYFNILDFPLARSIARSTGWLVSTVHVYDGDYWEHLACSGDEEIHQFCSWPEYWADESPQDYQRMIEYDDDPARLASMLDLEPQDLEPYLVSIDTLQDPNQKAKPTDSFPLENFWVFTDFWEAMGIRYPDPPEGLEAVVRFGDDLLTKLPEA